MQLANLPPGTTRTPASLVRQPPVIPEEPRLPTFRRLARLTQTHFIDEILAGQEMAVLKDYVAMVANRSSTDPEALIALRGSLARDIRGLQNLRDEFEGPISIEDEPPTLDEDVPAPAGGR